MIGDIASTVLGWLLLLLVGLHVFNDHWFQRIITRGTDALIVLSSGLLGVLYGLLLVIPVVIRNVLKASIVGVFISLVVGGYLLTFLVPNTGRYALKLRNILEEYAPTSYVEDALGLREIIVGIVAKYDDRDYEFETSDKYREELDRIKRQGKARLDTGETVISVLLGAVLVGSSLTGVNIFQQTIYKLPAGTIIEVWLLMISVSIIYRSTGLELIAYSSENEFESMDEMDAALSYQKGICLYDFFQLLNFIVLIAFGAISVSDDVMKELLETKYTGGEWIRLAFKRILD